MIRATAFRTVTVSALAALALAPAARANIIAAVEQPAGGGRTDLDIALYDATAGTKLTLPAGVNTTDDELHPSITPDGRRLVFERLNSAGGTVRIIIVDLSTGVSADLFSGFETSAIPPNSPAITADGKTVITGRPAPPGVNFVRTLTLTDISAFPAQTTGPFPHSDFAAGENGGQGGQTLEPAAGMDGLVAFEPRVPGLVQEVDVQQLGQTATCSGGPFDGNFDQSQPALAAASSDYMLYVQRAFPGGAPHPGDIWFAALHPAPPCARSGSATRCPRSSTPRRMSRGPRSHRTAATSGSSVNTSDGHSRLFTWDSQTQLAGQQLGDRPRRPQHARDRPHRRTAGTSHSAPLRPQVRSRSTAIGTHQRPAPDQPSIGILVQRVVGHQQLLGRTAPRLKLIGRVPLGRFPRGSVHVRWDRKVDGHARAPGLYQITVRALAPNGRVEDLGKPRRLRIR